MPTSYTSLIGLALPVTGELSGTWGDTVNNYITNYLDSAVAGTQTISGSQTAVTLSVTNGSSLVTAGSGSTGSAQFQIINCTGNPAGLLTITAPASSRQYIIINATSTSQSVKIVGTGPTTGVTILSGEKAHVAWNGSDFVKIATQSGNGSFVDLTVSGSMTLSGGTANGVLYLNGSKVATSGSALTFDGTNLVNLGGTVRAQAASTQDALQIQGRAGGTSSFITTLTPGTLTASNTLTLPIGTTTLAGLGTAQTFSATQTFSGAVTMSSATSTLSIGTSQTTGVTTIGGTAQTGTLTFGRSTGAQTLDIGVGATTSGTTKTINFGTAGLSGSTTNLNYGSAVSGATVTHTWSSGANSMTLDSSGNLGLGVTPSTVNTLASYKSFEVSQAGNAIYAGNNQVILGSNTKWDGGTAKYAQVYPATIYDQANGAHKWYNAASGAAGTNISFTQAMTLDASGNLGIGTTTPGTNLHIGSGSSPESLGVTLSRGAVTNFYLAYDGTKTFIAGTDPSESYAKVGTLSSHPVRLVAQNGTGYAHLDTSGNLGLGVTPSGGTYPALEFGAPGIIRGNGDMNIASNAYYNAGWKYKNNGTATLFLQTSGQNQWYTAPSSTAGTAVTWTQAMTLTAAGVQLLGTTTSPSGSAPALVVQTTVGGGVQYAHGSGGGGVIYALSGGGLSLNTYTGAVGSESYTERARITSGGKVAIGNTAAPQGRVGIWGSNAGSIELSLDSSPTYGEIQTYSSSPLYLNRQGNNVISNSGGGNLLVGTTTAGAGIGFDVKLAVDAGSGETSIFKTSSSGAYPSRMWNSATTGDNTFSGFLTEGGGTLRGSITYNRAAGLVAYNTTSDYRAKDIIGPVQNPGATIDAIKVYEGKMKGATQSRPMLVAHEAQDHAPYAVTGEKDAVNEDGTPKYQQMDVSSLVPLLLAEIQSLRARVAQLESKGV